MLYNLPGVNLNDFFPYSIQRSIKPTAIEFDRMVSMILTFALVANICLVSAVPISRRSLEKNHKVLLWYFGSFISFAILWFGGFAIYDKVKASYAAKLKAKPQANQNSDLEAGLATELGNVQFPEPAKTKGSTSKVYDPTKKPKTQNLHSDVQSGPATRKRSDPKKPKTQNLRADVQSGLNTKPKSGPSVTLNHSSSGSTLKGMDRPPANIENS
jgi:hypothetical protein